MDALKPILDAIQAMGAAGGLVMFFLYLRSEAERKTKDGQLLEVTREAIEATKSATASIDLLRVAMGSAPRPPAPPGGGV